MTHQRKIPTKIELIEAVKEFCKLITDKWQIYVYLTEEFVSTESTKPRYPRDFFGAAHYVSIKTMKVKLISNDSRKAAEKDYP